MLSKYGEFGVGLPPASPTAFNGDEVLFLLTMLF